MARFSQGLFNALSNPSYASSLGALGEQIGSAQAMGRERERQSNRFNTALDATSRGIASAQLGDTTALTSQMGQLRELLKDPNMPIEEKRLYIQELRALQAMMPGAQKIQTSNSATALMRIDNELEDEAALRAKIDQGYEKQGMAPISDAAFKAMTDSLKTQQKRLLENPNVSSEYNKLSVEQGRQRLERRRIASEEWLQTNRPKLQRAIESGEQKNLDAVLESVPPEYAEQAKDFVSSEMAFQREMQEFADNSILRSQEPRNTDFSESIARLPEGLQDEQIKALNDEYVAYIKKNWNADKKEWIGGVGVRRRASTMEEELMQMIRSRNNAATNSAWATAEDEKLRVAKQIEDAERSIRTYPSQVPPRDIKYYAEQFAEEDGEDFDRLNPDEKANYRQIAKEYLIQENERTQLALIADVDVTRAPAVGITQQESDRLSRYSAEEQEYIMDEYGDIEQGQMSLTQIMNELEEDGIIVAPKKEEPPREPVLYRKEPGFPILKGMEERYRKNIEGLAGRRAETAE